MHRRDILKSTLASMLGVTFGYAGKAEEKELLFENKCDVKCSTDPNQDLKAFRPDKWGGPNTVNGHTHLTYYLWSRDDDLEESLWDSEVAKSFNVWAEVTNLSFQRIDDVTNSDIIIGASNRRRSGFGESGGILAWAQLPRDREFDGQLWSMFDVAENWTIDSKEEQGILLRAVCAHEIGHLLGLGHSKFETALMFPYYNVNIETPQIKDDIPRIEKLYGKAK